MSSHTTSSASFHSSSQSAYQPPAYIYFLSAQNISVHGKPLTESPLTTWKRRELTHHQGKSTTSWSRGPQAISAEVATEQRGHTGTSSAKKVLQVKSDRHMVNEEMKIDGPVVVVVEEVGEWE